MLFCPTCGNILLIEQGSGCFRYFCKTCPYVFNINQTIKRVEMFDDKKVDIIYGGKEALKDASTTTINCSKCGNDKAYYKEIQTRSADQLFAGCNSSPC